MCYGRELQAMIAAGEAGGPIANTAYETLLPGVGTEQARLLAAQTGDFGALGLGRTMEAAATAEGLSDSQRLGGKYGGKALGFMGSDAGKAVALTLGAGLLNQGSRSAPQAPSGGGGRFAQGPASLGNPYATDATPQQYGDRPPPGMTWSEWERRKRMGLLGGSR